MRKVMRSGMRSAGMEKDGHAVVQILQKAGKSASISTQ